MRKDSPKEFLHQMIAHSGKCIYCEGVVKMTRHRITCELDPKKCFCLQCGQKYWMDILDIEEWEREQWRQKKERLGIKC
jgi:hypothetical protein